MKRIAKLVVLLGMSASMVIACQKESMPAKDNQNNFPITPRSSTLWHAIPSSVPTINHMYNPTDLDDQGVNMAMYATSLVLKELVCQFPGFSIDLYNARDNNHEVILKEFFDAHSIYQTFAETEFANLGESYQDIIEEGTLAYDDRWGMSVYMPHHVDSLGEEFPRWPHIGIGTDVEDQDDVDMEYIPAFINQNRQGCDYEDGLIGVQQSSSGRINPVILFGSIIVGITTIYANVTTDFTGNALYSWTDEFYSDPQVIGCDLGSRLHLKGFSVYSRLDRSRHSEVAVHYASYVPFTYFQNYSSFPGAAHIDAWASANQRYKLGKVHRNDLGVHYNINLQIDSWFRDGYGQNYIWPIGYTNSTFLTPDDFGVWFVGMTFERDWYATMKQYRFIDDNRIDDESVEIQGRMKYGNEIYNRFLIYPFEWCHSRSVIYSDKGYSRFESQN